VVKIKRYLFVIAAFVLLGCVVIFGVIGVYKTEDGLVLGLPAYERRDVHVSPVDLDILMEATALLSSEDRWARAHPADCAQSDRLDLYCALERASVKVMGRYVHRQPALQEVRFVIDDDYRARWARHRLVDFNENRDTHFADVQAVLAKAMGAVSAKLAAYQ